MCRERVGAILTSVGAGTKILRVQDFAAAFSAEIAAGCRAALFFSEERRRDCEVLLCGLGPFSPLCALVDDSVPYGIFSLPDEVRAAVGFGKNGIVAARFFATVRGCPCIAVPSSPEARECFFEGSGPPFSGYPLHFPEKVFLNDNFLRSGFGAALSRAALAALCAEELRTDALYSGKERDVSAFSEIAECIRRLRPVGAQAREELFYASALFTLSQRGMPDFACMGMADFLQRQAPAYASHAAFAVLKYCAERMNRLYGRARPRAYFVADYAGRVREAAERTGRSLRALFANVSVPTAEESFARLRVFEETRRKMYVSAQIFSEYVHKAGGVYYAEEGALPDLPLEEGYSLSAELTPLLCAPVLEREFGLLCGSGHMRPGA